MAASSTISGLLAVNVELREFLQQPTRSHLVLPEFQGGTSLQGQESLYYRGPTFSERDSKAAFYIQGLLLHALQADDIRIVSPASLVPSQLQDLTFLFGSRSNPVVQALLTGFNDRKVQFVFGANWEIRCAGQTFAIADPSTVDSAAYEASDDYGVVVRIRRGPSSCAFLVAGLGARATEGSAWFLSREWRQLHQEFGASDFAVVLRFPASFAVDRGVRVASSRWPATPPAR